MNRRDTAFALLALAAVPFAARALDSPRNWRVGFLTQRRPPVSIDADFLGAFPRAMRELGYVEGRNLVIEWRFADAGPESLAAHATELVRIKMDVLVSGSSQAISALKAATSSIPIVMATSGDPVGSGFVKSLARPEGNITGLSNLSSEFGTKQVELMADIVPKLACVGVLVNPANPSLASYLARIQSTAQARGIKVLVLEARNEQQIDDAFPVMVQGGAQAVIVSLDSVFIGNYRKIAALAASNRMASVSPAREFVDAGGMVSYGPNLAEQLRRTATYVDKIFRGAKPGDLPVEQTSSFELLINANVARSLGIVISPELRLRAERVIE